MNDGLSVQIGACKFNLRKSEHRFRVLQPSRLLLQTLHRDRRVRGLYQESGSALRVALNDSRDLRDLMQEIRTTHVAHHAYYFEDDLLDQPFIPTGVVHLSLEPYGEVAPLAERYKLKLLGEFTGTSPIYRLALTQSSPGNPLKVANALRHESGVRFCEVDNLSRTRLSKLPSRWADQWHLQSTSPGLNIAEAWKATRGDPSTVVCVFDDGFDLSNADLVDRVVHPSDFAPYDGDPDPTKPLIPSDTLPYPNAQIGDYHGTPCAGLAIARGADAVVGVAPECSWMPVRARFGFSSVDLSLRIFEYISRYADVVSCSWGARPSPFEAPSTAMLEVMDRLLTTGGRRGNGLIVCFAAGNENLPTRLPAIDNPGMEYFDDSTGRRLGTYFQGREIHSSWCEIPGVVVVGAITSTGEKASYSNWGKELTVCAPSGEWQVQQDASRRRANTPKLWTTDNEKYGRGLADVGLASSEMGSITDSMTGTSGAVPLVAGACALVVSNAPGISARQVRAVIAQTATTQALKTGMGLKDFHNNRNQDGSFDAGGHSLWYGSGLVCPAEALKASQS